VRSLRVLWELAAETCPDKGEQERMNSRGGREGQVRQSQEHIGTEHHEEDPWNDDIGRSHIKVKTVPDDEKVENAQNKCVHTHLDEESRPGRNCQE